METSAYKEMQAHLQRLLERVSALHSLSAQPTTVRWLTAEEVCTIVATGQADVLKTVKGLGLKTAQKIIVELRDKIGAGSAAATSVPVQGAVGETFSEAVAALTMLGFTRQATEKALRAIQQESPAASVEELVRLALKRL